MANFGTEAEARHVLREILIATIPAIATDDATIDQMTHFADSIVRAIVMLIEAKQVPQSGDKP